MSRWPIFQIYNSKFTSCMNETLGTSERFSYCPLVPKKTHYTSARLSGFQCSSLRIATLVRSEWTKNLATFRTKSYDKQLSLVTQNNKRFVCWIDVLKTEMLSFQLKAVQYFH